PIIRTFAPVVAGAGRMPYRRFVAYSVVGAVSWITSMILLGYYLTTVLDPILSSIFGRQIEVARNIDQASIGVIARSGLPLAYKAFKHWRERRAAKLGAANPTTPA